MEEEQRPVWSKCGECGHIWACAYAPMNMMAIAKLFKNARCPKCASPKAMLAKQNNGVLKEPQP